MNVNEHERLTLHLDTAISLLFYILQLQ